MEIVVLILVLLALIFFGIASFFNFVPDRLQPVSAGLFCATLAFFLSNVFLFKV